MREAVIPDAPIRIVSMVVASLFANVCAARRSWPGLSLASKERAVLPLLPFVECANAMKAP
jgi:hypothetical protein